MHPLQVERRQRSPIALTRSQLSQPWSPPTALRFSKPATSSPAQSNDLGAQARSQDPNMGPRARGLRTLAKNGKRPTTIDFSQRARIAAR